MCERCIFKLICKFVEYEMNKEAGDNHCSRFIPIPPFPVTDSEDEYLI